MRVYVAAPWTHKAEAKRYADALGAAGHEITKKWWEHREVPGYLDPAIGIPERKELEQQAAEDLAGVLAADAFLLLNLEKSEGKAVETGIAILAMICRIAGQAGTGPTTHILVGGKSNLFHYFPLWEDATSLADVIALLQ